MNKYLCYILFIISSSVSAQIPDSVKDDQHYIINASIYRKGIYKTFEEFKYNSPSITEDFIPDKKTITVTNKATGKSEKLDLFHVWGYCDGRKLYAGYGKFDEIVLLGRYCYFHEEGTGVIIGAGFAAPSHHNFQFIINFNTGKRYELDNSLIKEIFKKDDPELLKDFNSAKNKAKRYQEFIQRYNARHASKIK